eukprot:COSAG06_NODE_157_length_21766_cov_172.214335_5_plen_52_part_00
MVVAAGGASHTRPRRLLTARPLPRVKTSPLSHQVVRRAAAAVRGRRRERRG